MPRSPRFDLPGLPQHLIVRGNDRQPIFFSDEDRSYFLKCLADTRQKRSCDIHAFVLMTNHVHLLATGRAQGSISRMMQDLGRAYVSHVNKLHGRTGALYEGRFKSSVVETMTYFLTCMRYIELNPVRARMVRHPSAYPWSSYRQNITGEPAGLITAQPEYRSLGRDREERAAAYERLLEAPLDEKEIDVIRLAVNQGKAIGSDTFCGALEQFTGRTLRFVPQGRPPRRSVPLILKKGL